ncbi:hypothetical protein PR202_gb25758 [Eleusine coracana subsp. coracana]|uniref:Aminotransferase-like plant mobile domain-containing protein n=1 Tax=Eleusine coracana subsp. coracana TaxID=191504 RepID=A0AAV5FPS4_ELECO|nr:hypothetical protein PR202_gb25758 [Eleusine coracana subsp. coracana]
MADGDEPLVQESTAQIVSGGGRTVRSAFFLLPRADTSRPPSLPSQPRDPGPVLEAELRAEFKGWAGSPGLWRLWVAKLRPRHQRLWQDVGILDAILATTSRVRRHEAALLQLAAFWSAGTNTFIFPWGEATVTLQDVAVLAGLPLLGGPVRAALPYELEREVTALESVRIMLNRSSKKKPTYGAWVKYFLEKDASELVEHGAFLSMWLSLFVFAAPPFNVVRREVFPLAVRLARGQSVALAPAALASIYNDLSGLKRHFTSDKEDELFGVSAPMHILQLWIWEHFPELRPEMANSPDPGNLGAPRAARWHDVSKPLNPKYVRAVFMSPMDFEWRPYGSSTFALPPEASGCWVHGQDIAGSKALLSFARCLHPCELVGIDCIEKYRPHRVARQLGFDQDVPRTVARVIPKWKRAWDTYNIKAENYAFLVPNHQPSVTAEYVKWWEPYSLACASTVADAVKMKRHHISVLPIKRKMEGPPATNSDKKLHVDTATRMPQPVSNETEDQLDHIPLVERLNSIIKMIPRGTTESVVTSAEHEQTAEGPKCFTPRISNVGARKASLQSNAEQVLSDVAPSSANIISELSCGPVTIKAHGKYLQQSKEMTDSEGKNRISGYDDALLHNAAQGAVSIGSNEATEATVEVDMLPTLEDFLVISDDESVEANGNECEVSTMLLESPMLGTKISSLQDGNGENQQFNASNDVKSQGSREMMVMIICSDESDKARIKEGVIFDEETMNENSYCKMHLKSGYILQETNEENQSTSERNDEQDNPMLKDSMVQSNRDCELATVLNDTSLRQDPDLLTHVANVQTDVGHLERSTEQCFAAGEIDSTDKGKKEDSVESNRKISGNCERSSSRLVDGIIEFDSIGICTKTLYYLNPFDLARKIHGKYANIIDVNRDVYLPRRAVGTTEMIKKASAIRKAEIAELMKNIDLLKEEIWVLEAAH